MTFISRKQFKYNYIYIIQLIFAAIRRSALFTFDTFIFEDWGGTALCKIYIKGHTQTISDKLISFLLFAVHHFYGDDIFGWESVRLAKEIFNSWHLIHNEQYYLFDKCTNEAGNNCFLFCVWSKPNSISVFGKDLFEDSWLRIWNDRSSINLTCIPSLMSSHAHLYPSY